MYKEKVTRSIIGGLSVIDMPVWKLYWINANAWKLYWINASQGLGCSYEKEMIKEVRIRKLLVWDR